MGEAIGHQIEIIFPDFQGASPSFPVFQIVGASRSSFCVSWAGRLIYFSVHVPLSSLLCTILYAY